MTFHLDKFDRVLFIILGLLLLGGNIVISLTFPEKTLCASTDLFVYEGKAFDCINKGCYEYNRTYISYITNWNITNWDSCSIKNEIYVKSSDSYHLIDEINRKNNTACYYAKLVRCYLYGYNKNVTIFVVSIVLYNILIVFLSIVRCIQIWDTDVENEKELDTFK